MDKSPPLHIKTDGMNYLFIKLNDYKLSITDVLEQKAMRVRWNLLSKVIRILRTECGRLDVVEFLLNE